jgi:thiamine pyrophosphokinase
MRTVIFVNGLITDYEQAQQWLRPADFLIGTNGGTLHCLALGRQPHAVIGDLDSLPPDLVNQLAEQGVRIERHSAAKNETDLDLAISYALRHGASEILLLGALGGRLDQMMGNVLLLTRTDWSVPISLADGNQLAQILRGGESLTLVAPVGSTVSVIPISPTVTGITYQGLLYPLEKVTLPLGSTRGISNVVAQLPATIQIETGLLLVVQTLAIRP